MGWPIASQFGRRTAPNTPEDCTVIGNRGRVGAQDDCTAAGDGYASVPRRNHVLTARPAGLLGIAAMLSPSPALAHADAGSSGLWGGFLHPLLGADHIAAMIAVGLWGALLGRPALWVLPIAFPLVMACGSVLGVMGLRLPGVEWAIALSAFALGTLVTLTARTSLGVATLLVGAFAVFHGYAHGAERQPGVDALAYSLGFVTATGLLHLAGLGLGLLARSSPGLLLVRAAGAVIAATGLAVLGGLA